MICIILICVIILILILNLYNSSKLLEGNWTTTEDFEDESGVKILLNIKNELFKKNCRIIMFNLNYTGEDDDAATRIFDGSLCFINYNPLTSLLLPTHGYIHNSGFSELFPKWIEFKFNPVKSQLKLYGKVCYADMIKM